MKRPAAYETEPGRLILPEEGDSGESGCFDRGSATGDGGTSTVAISEGSIALPHDRQKRLLSALHSSMTDNASLPPQIANPIP